jgi:hypothetical protein
MTNYNIYYSTPSYGRCYSYNYKTRKKIKKTPEVKVHSSSINNIKNSTMRANPLPINLSKPFYNNFTRSSICALNKANYSTQANEAEISSG